MRKVVAIVPGGCKLVLQSWDVSVNKHFNNVIPTKSIKYMSYEGKKVQDCALD